MSNEEPKEFFDRLAGIIAVIFHPLLMPVYGMGIIFSAPTLFGFLPFSVKKLLFLIMLINNVFLPVSLMPFFLQRKIISSWSMQEMKERNIPLIVTTVLYGSTCFMIFRFPVPAFLKSYLFAILILSVVVTIVNFWWKISIHSVGAGAIIALIITLSIRMVTPLEWYLIPAVLISGFILFSRLKLNLHNPQQVWTGFFAGFFGLVLFMMAF